jgi:hypothetical protein
MCDLSTGRIEPCKNGIGGIKSIYLMPFVKYRYYQIDVIEGVQLISFPSTNIYKYELRADGNTFDQSINFDSNGETYTQNLSVVLKKIDTLTNNELFKIAKRELRVIVETNLNTFFILGLRNGVTMDFNSTIGGAYNSLNGYNLTFEATEKYLAPFIDNLQDAGFIDSGDTVSVLASTDLISSTSEICSIIEI